MKVLQVITSLSTGGAEKLISEISPMLRDKGHQVDVLAFDGKDTAFKQTLIDNGIKVYSFGKKCNIYNPLFIFRLSKLMKKYDIVHTHNTAPQLFAAIGSMYVLSCFARQNIPLPIADAIGSGMLGLISGCIANTIK